MFCLFFGALILLCQLALATPTHSCLQDDQLKKVITRAKVMYAAGEQEGAVQKLWGATKGQKMIGASVASTLCLAQIHELLESWDPNYKKRVKLRLSACEALAKQLQGLVKKGWPRVARNILDSYVDLGGGFSADVIQSIPQIKPGNSPAISIRELFFPGTKVVAGNGWLYDSGGVSSPVDAENDQVLLADRKTKGLFKCQVDLDFKMNDMANGGLICGYRGKNDFFQVDVAVREKIIQVQLIRVDATGRRVLAICAVKGQENEHIRPFTLSVETVTPKVGKICLRFGLNGHEPFSYRLSPKHLDGNLGLYAFCKGQRSRVWFSNFRVETRPDSPDDLAGEFRRLLVKASVDKKFSRLEEAVLSLRKAKSILTGIGPIKQRKSLFDQFSRAGNQVDPVVKGLLRVEKSLAKQFCKLARDYQKIGWLATALLLATKAEDCQPGVTRSLQAKLAKGNPSGKKSSPSLAKEYFKGAESVYEGDPFSSSAGEYVYPGPRGKSNLFIGKRAVGPDIKAQIRAHTGSQPGSAGLVFAYADYDNYHSAYFNDFGDNIYLFINQLRGGNFIVLAEWIIPRQFYRPDSWNDISLTVKGRIVKLCLNASCVLQVQANGSLTSGPLGLFGSRQKKNGSGPIRFKGFEIKAR